MSHDVSSEVYPDFEANDVTYAYDYWRDTPAFDALEAISGGNIETGLAVVSILITIVVAYSASRKDAPRYAFLFGYAFVSAYISGAISYILLVQMSSFDLAHWFASFATPVVAIHLLFFASLFSLALQAFWLASFEMQHQAEKATREGAGWRATRLIVFLSISMLMTIIGFFDCRDVLFSFVCKNVSGLGEWRVAAATISKLFGIFALSGLIAQGYCTVRNQKPKRR